MKKMIISFALIAGLMSANANAWNFPVFGKQARTKRAEAKVIAVKKATALKTANDTYKAAFKTTVKSSVSSSSSNCSSCCGQTSNYKDPEIKAIADNALISPQLKPARKALVDAYNKQGVELTYESNKLVIRSIPASIPANELTSANTTITTPAETKLNEDGINLIARLEKEAKAELKAEKDAEWVKAHTKLAKLLKAGKITIKTAIALTALVAGSVYAANHFGYVVAHCHKAAVLAPYVAKFANSKVVSSVAAKSSALYATAAPMVKNGYTAAKTAVAPRILAAYASAKSALAPRAQTAFSWLAQHMKRS